MRPSRRWTSASAAGGAGSGTHRTARDTPFKGEYLEVDPPSRLVYTEIFDVAAVQRARPDAAAINTITYEDLGGRTKVVARSRFPSVEILEGALATGMIGGALESYDRLGELIDEAAKR